MLKQFQSVRFDDDNKKLDILMGTIGEISYEAIEKAAVLNEEASFHGKSIPFSHQVLGGTTFLSGALEPRFYVGIKITLKDGSIRAIYISKIKTGFNTDLYHKDTQEAKEIQKMIQKRISASN